MAVIQSDTRPCMGTNSDRRRPRPPDCTSHRVSLSSYQLRALAYERVVGPRLSRDGPSLSTSAPEVVSCWDAIEALCDWMIDLGPAAGASTEVPVSIDLREPGWRDSVRLTGAADGLFRHPSTGRWCVVELKLGRSRPHADLAQAALYHLALAPEHDPSGALALVRFRPEREEVLVPAAEALSARPAFMALIGKLADVLPHEVPNNKDVSPEARPFEFPADEVRSLGERLLTVLREYGVTAKFAGEPRVGPTYIRFEVEPGHGVKVAALEQRTREVRMRLELGADPILTITEGAIAFDIERTPRRLVPFADVRDQIDPPRGILGNPRMPIGVGLDGRLRQADLARNDHAHFLVAGTTGSGKSEWLRTAIAGLVLGNTPEDLRFLLIDPKRTAFGWLRESPFLLRPIVFTDETAPTDVLSELIDIMEERYRQFAETGTDDLVQHVRETERPMPRIVCICDEYFDLVQGDNKQVKEIEQRITKLGAKARSAGIHLVLATQQPSRKTLSGVLDANILARVGLKMAKSIESRMLLQRNGAEDLLGNGDLLFKDDQGLVRLQAPLLSVEDRDSIGRLGGRPTRQAVNEHVLSNR